MGHPVAGREAHVVAADRPVVGLVVERVAPAFKVRDLLDDQAYDWTIGRNYVRLAPGHRMAHVMRVER